MSDLNTKDQMDANRAAEEFWGPQKTPAHVDVETALSDLINSAVNFAFFTAGVMPLDTLKSDNFKVYQTDLADALATARENLTESLSQ